MRTYPDGFYLANNLDGHVRTVIQILDGRVHRFDEPPIKVERIYDLFRVIAPINRYP